MHELSLLFRDQIISKRPWPVCSLDVTTGFFLWGYIKDSSYHNNSWNLNELKTNITADISTIMLQAVSANMLHCAQLCMQHAGACFQNFL